MSFVKTLISLVPPRIWVWTLSLLLLVTVLILLLVAGVCITAYHADRQFHLFGWEFGPVPYDGTKFENAIIITDSDCASLGPGWKTYGQMAGRFPVGAGQGNDINGVIRSFAPGQRDTEGEYVHTLSIPEMPEHRHKIESGRMDRRRCTGGCYSWVKSGIVETGPTGESSPHNNLPPYSVVNFCKLILD